jgi:RNA 2',3'-cyclic 3'-phosphodiesterase
MDSDKTIRTFLAVAPPAEILQEIGKIQISLKCSCPFDIRWLKPESIHLTLKFFGNLSGADVITVSRVVERHSTLLAPLQLTVKKLGVFPSLQRPRVLWIGLEGETAPLSTLQRHLEQEWADCGFTREDRPFRPHLTIGRIKSSRLTGDPVKFMAQAGDWSAGNFRAAGLTLFQSDLTPQGAVYTQLAWFPFGSG